MAQAITAAYKYLRDVTMKKLKYRPDKFFSTLISVSLQLTLSSRAEVTRLGVTSFSLHGEKFLPLFPPKGMWIWRVTCSPERRF